ncbi:MAG: hypothetical protein AAGF95_24720 [Chloroflexota bacterium]
MIGCQALFAGGLAGAALPAGFKGAGPFGRAWGAAPTKPARWCHHTIHRQLRRFQIATTAPLRLCIQTKGMVYLHNGSCQGGPPPRHPWPGCCAPGPRKGRWLVSDLVEAHASGALQSAGSFGAYGLHRFNLICRAVPAGRS